MTTAPGPSSSPNTTPTDKNRPRIALLSPFHGGSHRVWGEGLARHSAFDIQILSLPAQFWKWRMHGGAVSLARLYRERFDGGDTPPPRAIVATDMCDLATTLTLLGDEPRPPAALYVHENQLTYPLPADPATGPMRRQLGERDRHYAWINVTSMLAADVVWFNSAFHRDEFLQHLPGFLRHAPDLREMQIVDTIAAKAEVLPIGLDLSGLLAVARPSPEPAAESGSTRPPRILWNQRWEYDKAPDVFFRALYRLQDRGLAFRLAVCGENIRQNPPEFEQARRRLEPVLDHWGFADGATYQELLREADLTVSTALHEFFGIAVVECMAAGVFPILPNRLNYPNLVPVELHGRCLYDGGESGLAERLAWAIESRRETARATQVLRESARRFDWSKMAAEYDRRLALLVRRK